MSVGRGEAQKAASQTHFLGAAALLPQCEPSESLEVQHGMSKTSWHKGDEEQRRCVKDDGRSIESQSLKSNPVLAALASGQFPNVRPNYDYFAHLLAQNLTVSVRPKTCQIFVSSPELQLREDRTITDRSGKALDLTKYPYLVMSVEDGESTRRGRDGSMVLHDYTSTISQSYSGPVKDITKHWETQFPQLHRQFALPQPQDEDFLTIIEMTLNGLVEMSIDQPALRNHMWKCTTRLARPQELCSDNEPLYLEHTDEMGVQFSHQSGCGSGNAPCDCLSRPRQDVRVPFPAAEWASMLTNCVEYPNATPEESRKRKGQASKSDGEECGSGGVPTQQGLLGQIGMVQELWSTAPTALISTTQWRTGSAGPKKWSASEPPTAQWRFLTVNDPTSEYHMRNAYVPSEEPTVPEATFLAPENLVLEADPAKSGVVCHGNYLSWNHNGAYPALIPQHWRHKQQIFQCWGWSTEQRPRRCWEAQADELAFAGEAPGTPGSNPFLTENMTMAAAAGMVYDDIVCDPSLQPWNTALPDIKPWVAGTDTGLLPLSGPADRNPEWPAEHPMGQILWDPTVPKEPWAAQPLDMALYPEWEDAAMHTGAGCPLGSGVLSPPASAGSLFHGASLGSQRFTKRARAGGVDMATGLLPSRAFRDLLIGPRG
ncbi:unnamed protein product [Parascedosporium putredinis]|uniref:Uncharacterized protein n=1 Tax=Parascedosporium putredinis TaxID=1442378 RepID=A0A9P1HBV1_9PEZI|nr:unnamed protein product [Parascedosporium putredinis]CAI8002579.1 unnamed protein product [Parascedosporium putredinis]